MQNGHHISYCLCVVFAGCFCGVECAVVTVVVYALVSALFLEVMTG